MISLNSDVIQSHLINNQFVVCKNDCCKYLDSDMCSFKEIIINDSGKCTKFEIVKPVVKLNPPPKPERPKSQFLREDRYPSW